MELWKFFIHLSALISAITAFQLSCPSRYKRFSLDHSFCLSWNYDCIHYHHNVSEGLKEHILLVHNRYRSRVANGDAGYTGMPKAANMLEMVWDDELEAIAQKWANSCAYTKDCDLCRMVDRFPVGQQMYSYDYGIEYRDLDMAFDISYMEALRNLEKSLISKYHEDLGGELYTQLLWANTWRIGCGWTLFKGNWNTKGNLVCNYGPTGNIENEPTYKIGDPCTACPANTCCGDSCKKYRVKANYDGLCKVIDENSPPEGNVPHQRKGIELFYCQFNEESDCSFSVEGTNRWNISKSNGGSWIRTYLNGGEWSSLNFISPIKSLSGKLCFSVVFQRGPTVANETYANKLFAKFEKENKFYTAAIFNHAPDDQRHIFTTGYFEPGKYPKDTDVTFSLTFAVPLGSPPQYLEIEKIIAEEKSCSKVTSLEKHGFLVE